ncbi:hypothetical protein [Desmonostoc muscorum]|uniref:hypothetical protein n=1 Tax=Desmonostoc muscorum TaxID=1179 RepID=UPI001F16FCB7|nr:hypothetical protein [Desmonostoc muscorum]
MHRFYNQGGSDFGLSIARAIATTYSRFQVSKVHKLSLLSRYKACFTPEFCILNSAV